MKKYFVKTSSNNLGKINHFKIYKLRVLEENLEFYCDENSLNELKMIIDLEYIDLQKENYQKILKKHLITIIGVILIIFFLINQSISISRVEFMNPDTYDPEVEDFLENYYKRVGPFNYINTDLTTINYEIKSKFYEYEWISINRVGSILYIDIKKQGKMPKDEDNTPGSIYASHSGIIKRYHIARGVVLVQEEVYVDKGDLLISGSITHYDNTIEEVRASGYVIAEVMEYYDYTIPKTRIIKQLSGKMSVSKIYSVFGASLNSYSSDFDKYELVEGRTNSILGIFKTKRVYLYEEESLTFKYSSEDAIKYAKSLVRRDFSKNKVNEFEEIIFNNVVRINEDEENYYIRLLVKSYRNIASFIPLKE